MANAWLVKPLPIVAASASGTMVGDPLNMGNDYAGVIWRSAQGGNAYAVLDLGSDVPLDTILLFGVWGNFDMSTARLRIALATQSQGPLFSTPDSFWLAPAHYLLAEGEPLRVGSCVFQWAAPPGAPAAVRYVYLNAIDLPSTGYVDFARAVVGKRIQLERNFGFGAGFGVRDLGSLDFSRRGVLQRTRGKKLRTASLTFSNINRDEVEATTKPLLEQLGNTEMAAVVIDPSASTYRQARSYFGPLVGDLGHVWRRATAWEAKVNMVSIF